VTSARIYRPKFAKTSLKRSFSMTENERFGFVFAKTGSINSGTCVVQKKRFCMVLVVAIKVQDMTDSHSKLIYSIDFLHIKCASYAQENCQKIHEFTWGIASK
jgi:hypothetical protein